ncbi:phosphodiester glycosidase family protein, partial [Bacillus rhizoplanae]|uniref:phosphodiester glycosidase family protein n=1 Tax=Bacillus rhizoplanae TaxID=2880966 RepID=UPI003D1AA0A0
MKKHLTKVIKVYSILLLVFILIGAGILFGTPYGHKLRVIAAESILTSQHRYLAKFTFLSQQELDDISNSINNPKWKNSQSLGFQKLSKQQLEAKKHIPLHIKIETIQKKYADHYFEGKLMTISNPLNVKLVTQQGTQGSDVGEKIYVMAKRNHAIAAINASGFSDETGHGGGKEGLGIVIENGQVIHTPKDINSPTIITGLTKYGQMVTGDYSAQQLLNKNIVSAAGFMPQLIVNGEKMLTNDGGWGYGPRSIMAQKKDGSIMFLIVDGRQPHSIGASLKDCQDLLYDEGAENAMAMDGGSSATMYALGDILNIPSTLSHKSRYLPNCWVVTANKNQKVDVTIDGHVAEASKIAEVTGTSAIASNETEKSS